MTNTDIKIQISHSGGHTIDHTMYLVKDGRKIFFTGDILHTISQLYSSIGPILHIEHLSITLLEQYLHAIELIKKEKPQIICEHVCIGTSVEFVCSIVKRTERIVKRIYKLIEENWRSDLSDQEIARRVFIDICQEVRYNPNLRFFEKLASGKTVYEKYDLPLILAMIKKYRQSKDYKAQCKHRKSISRKIVIKKIIILKFFIVR